MDLDALKFGGSFFIKRMYISQYMNSSADTYCTGDCKMFLFMAYGVNFIFMAYEGPSQWNDRQTDIQTEGLRDGRANGQTNRQIDRRY